MIKFIDRFYCNWHWYQISIYITQHPRPADEFYQYKFGHLAYRSLRLEFETFDKESYQPAPVVLVVLFPLHCMLV